MINEMKTIFKWTLPLTRWIIIGMLIAIVAPATGIFSAYIGAIFIDNIIVTLSSNEISYTLYIVYLIVIFIYVTFTLLYDFYGRFFGEQAARHMRSKIYSHYIHMQCRTQRKMDDVKELLFNDVNRLQDIFPCITINLVGSAFSLIFTIIWLLNLDWRLAILVLPVPVIFLLYSNSLSRSMMKLGNALAVTSGRFLRVYSQIVVSLQTVKLNGLNQWATRFIMGRSYENSNSKVDMGKYINLMTMSWQMVIMPIQAVILFIGGIFYIETGYPSIGILLSVNVYLAILVTGLINIYQLLVKMQSVKANVQRIGMYLQSEIEGGDSLIEGQDQTIEYELSCVQFSYNNELVLKNIALNITKGKHVAIVGESGSGKSTLLRLLKRLEDADSGLILANSINIANLNPENYRRNLSSCEQKINVFSTSLYENIVCVQPEATEDEVKVAIKIAQLDTFLLKQKMGLDTLIGEGGVSLSGGERQRLELARAILRNGSVFLLDEPTAALDTLTETRVMDSLLKYAHNKTIILITHRLELTEQFDMVVRMQDGILVQTKGS